MSILLQRNMGFYPFDYHWNQYSYWAYSKPYTRVPVYFGVMAAWLLAEMEGKDITRETRSRSFLARSSAVVAAGIAGALFLVITFIIQSDFGEHKDSWGTLASCLYLVFARPVWGMCLATITLLCYYDYLPVVNGILSHPYWTPFARLTYGAYLVHPMVIKLASGRALQYLTFNCWDMIYRTCGNVIMAYGGSVVLWVLVERPCMTMFAPARKASPKKDSAESASAQQTISGSSSPGQHLSRDDSRLSSNADCSFSDADKAAGRNAAA